MQDAEIALSPVPSNYPELPFFMQEGSAEQRALVHLQQRYGQQAAAQIAQLVSQQQVPPQDNAQALNEGIVQLAEPDWEDFFDL